ncbi:FKBP-type peptidyl-prolyl cis-trans isomerase [Bacteroidota bacterium]
MKKIKLLIFVGVIAVFTSGCSIFKNAESKEYKKTESGLKYKITEKGDGAQAKKGDVVAVHYKGMFTDEKVFDSSYERGKPIQFELGAGKVIKGWDEGIALLHVGDKAEFIIPSHLGYGSRDNGPIPANSTLVFEVELVAIK